MNLEKIKLNISEILDAGGSVSFNYKGGMKDWYQTITIHYFKGLMGMPPKYHISNGPAYGDYTSKEEAIDKIVNCIFNENNLAVVIDSLTNRIGDLDEHGFDFERPSKEFLDLIEKEKQLIKEENEDSSDIFSKICINKSKITQDEHAFLGKLELNKTYYFTKKDWEKYDIVETHIKNEIGKLIFIGNYEKNRFKEDSSIGISNELQRH
jgi:hypothetical protein